MDIIATQVAYKRNNLPHLLGMGKIVLQNTILYLRTVLYIDGH